ncbi:hypothetical protein Patl1_09869 [Pistacia atlantica]|uniref:Uncharacterized protein n=1 Tax=Pistacia atlantica TaxID=434234 RepID=A0ACC1A900_9ROSI|nr:hypothetical protein Patl1_09869 [Pistacia atlantica]
MNQKREVDGVTAMNFPKFHRYLRRSSSPEQWLLLVLVVVGCLFERGISDQGKPSDLYNSEKRSELVKEGYKIHGSSGDQWSDLVGFFVAKRSFKLPNPMYYIPKP